MDKQHLHIFTQYILGFDYTNQILSKLKTWHLAQHFTNVRGLLYGGASLDSRKQVIAF